MRDLSIVRCPVLTILRRAARIPLRMELPVEPEKKDPGFDARKEIKQLFRMPEDTLGQRVVQAYYQPGK